VKLALLKIHLNYKLVTILQIALVITSGRYYVAINVWLLAINALINRSYEFV